MGCAGSSQTKGDGEVYHWPRALSFDFFSLVSEKRMEKERKIIGKFCRIIRFFWFSRKRGG